MSYTPIVTKVRPPKHYHVAAICSQVSAPSIIRRNEGDAICEWAKMVDFVKDATGLEIDHFLDQKAIFFDGSTVRWWACEKNCDTPKEKEDA